MSQFMSPRSAVPRRTTAVQIAGLPSTIGFERMHSQQKTLSTFTPSKRQMHNENNCVEVDAYVRSRKPKFGGATTGSSF